MVLKLDSTLKSSGKLSKKSLHPGSNCGDLGLVEGRDVDSNF
jgi:hypothetical protein